MTCIETYLPFGYFLLLIVVLYGVASLTVTNIITIVSLANLLFGSFFIISCTNEKHNKGGVSILSAVSSIVIFVLFNRSYNLSVIFLILLTILLFLLYLKYSIGFFRFVVLGAFLICCTFANVIVSKFLIICLLLFPNVWILLEMLVSLRDILNSNFSRLGFLGFFILFFSLLASVGFFYYFLNEKILVLFSVMAISLLIPISVVTYQMALKFFPFATAGFGLVGVLTFGVLGKVPFVFGTLIFSVILILGGLILLEFYDLMSMPVKIQRDIQNFKAKLFSGNYSSLSDVVGLFNSSSNTIKITIVEENRLPLGLLTMLIAYDKVLYNDVKDNRYISNFFTSNRIMGIFRMSNSVFENLYMMIKKNDNFLQLSKEDKILLDEIVDLISNFVVAVSGEFFDEERVNFVKEIESFDKIKEFLIKNSYLYFFRDKIVAYKFIEDTTSYKGYYFDIFMEPNRLFIIFMNVPDRLLLSNFVLLSLKGVIKTLPSSDINYEKLQTIVRNYITESDLPLSVFISTVEVSDKTYLNLSDNTKVYAFVDSGELSVISLDSSNAIENYKSLILSNKDISKFLPNFTDILERDISNENKVKEILELINEYDTFVMIIL